MQVGGYSINNMFPQSGYSTNQEDASEEAFGVRAEDALSGGSSQTAARNFEAYMYLNIQNQLNDADLAFYAD